MTNDSIRGSRTSASSFSSTDELTLHTSRSFGASSHSVDVLSPVDNEDTLRDPQPNGSTSSGHIRWAILSAACLVMFGNYYAFDNPASLNKPLQDYMEMSDDSYAYFLNLLYTSYSLPNIVLPWLGGYASDKFGHRRLLLSLSAMVAMGHFVVCLGVERRSVPAMILGRVLFGAGESLAVAQSALTVKYFRGKELAMALGINLCIARLGSVLNDILTPAIWARSTVPMAFWGGFVSCVLSFLMACLLVALDRRYGSEIPQSDSSPGFSRLPTSLSDARFSTEGLDFLDDDESQERYDPPTPGKAKVSFSGEAIGLEEIRRTSPRVVKAGSRHFASQTHQRSTAEGAADDRLDSAQNERFSSEDDIEEEGEEDMDDLEAEIVRAKSTGFARLADSGEGGRRISSLRECMGMFRYSQSAWVLFVMTFLLVGVQVPFNSIHAGFLQQRWYHNDPQKAAQIMTVPDLLSAILVLPVGYFVDHYGQKSWLFMLCGLIIGGSHTVLGLVPISTPVPALLALGVASAIGALFTSAIPVLVKSHQIATAYGISSSAMNLAFTLFPLIVAKLMTVDPSVYTYVEVFFALCGFFGFLLAARLRSLDTYGDLDRREIDNKIVDS
ncbi:hypothetical protein EMPS_10196 [Entomortierella parvispora]|uniref:Lysosomal dipeptide transporter MFSD1 n=1 Tax=Entomortierella parvispora TaxID=205924 RepID=A0A9P3HKC3_9FUNG|nr:hypothetical protein EMPS_10196 [Entomortierella parvispora]